MRHTLEASMEPLSPALDFFNARNKKELFRERFRCALEQCVRHGFQVEECFGVIWEETVEEVELPFRDQNELFPEMIKWAKGWMMQQHDVALSSTTIEVDGLVREILPSMSHG